MPDIIPSVVERLSVVKANSEIHEAHLDNLGCVLDFLIEKSGSEFEPVEYTILKYMFSSLLDHYYHFDDMIDEVFKVLNL